MLRCGKTAQSAISAMSLLAERFDGDRVRLSSLEVAEERKLPKPLVAKVLTVLSTANLVNGTRGPGGGYWLAKPPAKITLADIATHFEKDNEGPMCPFGPEWCGNGAPCPMHDDLARMQADWEAYMRKTTLAVFMTKKRA